MSLRVRLLAASFSAIVPASSPSYRTCAVSRRKNARPIVTSPYRKAKTEPLTFKLLQCSLGNWVTMRVHLIIIIITAVPKKPCFSCLTLMEIFALVSSIEMRTLPKFYNSCEIYIILLGNIYTKNYSFIRRCMEQFVISGFFPNSTLELRK